MSQQDHLQSIDPDLLASGFATPKPKPHGVQPFKTKKGAIKFQPDSDWSLSRLSEVETEFQKRTGKLLPVRTRGQGAIHDRWGYEHSDSADISLHPTSNEGKILGEILQEKRFPFLAFEHAIPGVATGPHYHLGRPSHKKGRSAAQKSPQHDPDLLQAGFGTAPEQFDIDPDLLASGFNEYSPQPVDKRGAYGAQATAARQVKPQIKPTSPFANVQVGVGPVVPDTGMGALHRIDDPKTAQINRIQRDVTAQQTPAERNLKVRPGARLMDTQLPGENEEVLRRVAEEESQRVEAAKANERYQREKPEIDRLAKEYRKGIQVASKVGQGVDPTAPKWKLEAAAKGGSGLVEKLAAAARAGLTSLPFDVPAEHVADTINVHAQAMHQAAVEEGADRNEASKWVQDIVGGFIASSPELAAMGVGVPAPIAFGAGEGMSAYGGNRPVAPAVVHGLATGAAFEAGGHGTSVGQVARKAGTVGALTTGIDVAAGQPLSEAAKSGATNALLVGVPGLAGTTVRPMRFREGANANRQAPTETNTARNAADNRNRGVDDSVLPVEEMATMAREGDTAGLSPEGLASGTPHHSAQQNRRARNTEHGNKGQFKEGKVPTVDTRTADIIAPLEAATASPERTPLAEGAPQAQSTSSPPLIVSPGLKRYYLEALTKATPSERSTWVPLAEQQGATPEEINSAIHGAPSPKGEVALPSDRAKFLEQKLEDMGAQGATFEGKHYQSVLRAWREGEDVSPDVLTEYGLPVREEASSKVASPTTPTAPDALVPETKVPGKEPWQQTQQEFVGPKSVKESEGGNFGDFTEAVSSRLEVDPATVRDVGNGYSVARGNEPLRAPTERRPSDEVERAKAGAVLLHDGKVVGAFVGDTLSISPEHRGQKLSRELYRERLKIGPISDTGSFSRAGQAASKSAHKAFVEEAMREGKPVPPEVLVDYPELKGAQPKNDSTATQDTSVKPTSQISSEGAGQPASSTQGREQAVFAKQAVNESPATMQAKMDEVNRGKLPVMLFNPDQKILSHKRGLVETKTEVGTFVHDPSKVKAEAIRAKVADGSFHELLGIAEKKSAETTRAVTTRLPDGTEFESASVSPGREAEQVKLSESRAPEGSKVETGGPEQAQQVLADRVDSPTVKNTERAGSSEGLAKNADASQGKSPYRTSEPVTIRFTRNTEGAAQYAPGGKYSEIVPGRYMVERPEGYRSPDARWEQGEVTFKNPLVVEFGGGYAEPSNWKRVLSERYGKSGAALTEAIKADGHDGVITYDRYGTSEIVDLGAPSKEAPTQSESVSPASERVSESADFNWHTRERDGEWAVLNPQGEEVSRVPERSVAESIVKEMRESDATPEGLSLTQAIRKKGGIKPHADNKGELSYLTNKESGSAGIVNEKSGRKVEEMARALAEEGYGLGDWAHTNPKSGTGFEVDLDRFREAVQEDLSGRKHYSTEVQPDYEAEYRKHAQGEQDEHDIDATVELLENEQSGILYDRISEGKATASEVEEFRQHANRLGISGEAQDKLIASARETGVQETGDAQEPIRPTIDGSKDRPVSTTAAKRDKVTEDRASRGEEPIPKPERKSDESLLADAKAANAKDPTEPMRLVDEVLNGNRGALSDKETVQLDLHVQGIKNKYDAVNKELSEAKDSTKIKELSDRSDSYEREIRSAEEAFSASGTEKGRALRAQRIEIDQDFRLLSMVSRAIKARGRELTTEERQTIKVQADKIADLEAKLEAANKRSDAARANIAIDLIRRDIKRENKKVARGERKASLDSEAQYLKQLIAQEWKRRSSVQPMGLAALDPEGTVTKLVLQLAKNRIQANVGLKAEALVDEIHGLLKDVVDLSRRDVAEMVSGYGKTFEMSQDVVDKRLRELRAIIAANLGKADIIEKGIAPLRRGMQRDKPTQEVRQAIRELKDALREQGIKVERSPRSVEEQQKSVMDAAKTQTRNRIEDLKAWIDAGTRIVRGKTEAIPDAELTALRGERDRLTSIFDAMDDPAADAKTIENKLRAANRSVDELQAQIRTGKVKATLKKDAGPTSPELEAARAEQKMLREIVGKLRATERQANAVPADPFEVEARKVLAANKAFQTRAEKQIGDFERRLKQGDFSEKAKREPIAYNRENLGLQKRLEQTKRDYQNANYRASRGTWGRIKDEAGKFGNLPKTMKSMADISAVFRQGGFYSLTHPIEGFAKPSADMLRAFTETGYRNVENAIKNHPRFEQAKRDGVEFTGVDKNDPNLSHKEEGYFGTEALDTISKGKFNPLRVVKAVAHFSERTFVSFLDSQRMHIYDMMAKGMESQGITRGKSPESYKAIGKLINQGTGRGTLGAKGNQAAPLLNLAMFSPRLVASRVQLLNNMFNPVKMARMPEGARSQMIKDNVKFLAGTAAVMGLGAALGGTVSLDPDDGDFLKIRFGKTTYDTLTGLQQPLKYIVNMARAATGGEDYPGKDMSDLTFGTKTGGGGFLPSKASPVASAVLESIKGIDFLGRARSKTERALDMVTPLPAKDFWEAMQKEGLVKGFLKTTPALTGVGVQTYDQIQEKPTTLAEKLSRKFVRSHIPDKARTDDEIETSRQLSTLRARSRKGEDVTSDLQVLGATKRTTDGILAAKDKTRLQEDFNRLGPKEALIVYAAASPKEREQIKTLLEKKTTTSDIEKLRPAEQINIRLRMKELGIVETAEKKRSVSNPFKSGASFGQPAFR